MPFRRFIAIVAILWTLATGIGLGAFWKYEATPGVAADAPLRAPVLSALPLDPRRPTVILFAHPSCACTRASIAELSKLMSDYPDGARAYVVFARLPGMEVAGTGNGLYADATRIPGARIISDKGGKITRQFGARTSGQALVYGRNGLLAFAGGITCARGHEGDNYGLTEIETILRGGKPDRGHTPVFGCSILGSSPTMTTTIATTTTDASRHGSR